MKPIRLITCILVCLFCTPVFANDLQSAYGALRRGNLDQAITAFGKAAEAGSVEAQHQLGKLYLSRAGGAEDQALGVQWLERAATSGESGAQYTLGLHLAQTDQREEGQRWLHRAAAEGSTQAARYLENQDQPTDNLTAVELASRWRSAARGCRVGELTELLQAGAEINTLDNYERSALHALIECGSAAGIEFVLQHGINIDQHDRYGETALSRAVAREDAVSVKKLVVAGATIGETSKSGATLVHTAVNRNSLATLTALLSGRPALDQVDGEGLTALDRAILQDRREAEQILRAAGAKSGHRLSAEGADEAVATHLARGVDDTAQWEVARQSALQDESRALRVLLERGGDHLVSQVDERGYSLLLYAAQAGSASAVDLLLSSGAKPNTVNSEDVTALMLAARKGHTSTVLNLLHGKADPFITDAQGRDAIDIALRAEQDGIAHTLLVYASPDSTARLDNYLHQAILRGATASTGWLLASNASTDAPDSAGRAPLWYAAKHCDEGLARQLIRRGAHLERAGEKGQNPLHIAARENCPAVTALLLDSGAAIDVRTALGNTPLLLAATHGATRSALLLAHRGADTHLSNAAGETALMHAVRGDNRSLVIKLLEHGADPFRRNELGDSALSLAERRDSGVLALLQERSAFRLPFFN